MSSIPAASASAAKRVRVIVPSLVARRATHAIGWRRRAVSSPHISSGPERSHAAGWRIKNSSSSTRYARVDVASLKPEQIVALLVPILAIQVGLMIAALVDLERSERRVRGGSKIVWALVIILVNILGPILYFVAGREES
jgi:hypothetical protein